MTPVADNVAFQAMVGLLQQSPEKVMLFVLGYGDNRFEREIPDLARVSGVPEGRLRELLAEARQGNSATSPTVPEQHVVTRALLARWCHQTKDGPRMGHYSLEYGPRPPTSPTSVAKLTNFVKFDSQRTESLWGLTESRLPDALAAADAGTLFTAPSHVGTIKDMIALHYARSFEVLDGHEDIWREGLEVAKRRFLEDPEHLSHVYFLKTGLHLPLTATSAHELVADELVQRTRDLFSSGVAFRFRVVDLFNAASAVVAGAGLQLLRTQSGFEFLIGDVPVITTDRSGNHQGISAGVPIGSAATVFLPLGPHLGVALGPRNEDVTIGVDHVLRLNTWEVQAARRGVFTRVGSPLITWAATIRPPSHGPQSSQPS
ncbi:MAG: DUF4238 domain-containing protein [Actinomycetota bacterium]|jgi:hypothetical protein|nr:DUF4238 domain-containing protein [Actinomycetota bacterium]